MHLKNSELYTSHILSLRPAVSSSKQYVNFFTSDRIDVSSFDSSGGLTKISVKTLLRQHSRESQATAALAGPFVLNSICSSGSAVKGVTPSIYWRSLSLGSGIILTSSVQKYIIGYKIKPGFQAFGFEGIPFENIFAINLIIGHLLPLLLLLFVYMPKVFFHVFCFVLDFLVSIIHTRECPIENR